MSTVVQQAPAFSPTPSQIAVAYSVCRSIARSSAKNFYYAFLALPQAKRQALCAIYAFMRRCDDITDDASLPLRDRRQKLAEWLDANPEDPDAPEIRRRHETNRDEYLRWGRDLLGWAIFVGWKPLG